MRTNKKKIIAAFSAVLLIASALPTVTAAAESSTQNHTVTILDFDGKPFDTITVRHGEVLEANSIDTSKLNCFPDKYTERRFNAWSNFPVNKAITEDISIQPLYKEMTISCDSPPSKTEYFSTKGKIDTDGMKVSIKVFEQVPKKSGSGFTKKATETLNIESKCTLSVDDLEEAFSDEKTSAEVKIYPVGSSQAIGEFEITYCRFFGDYNKNGIVDIHDASNVLSLYGTIATNINYKVTDEQMLICDADRNGVIDPADSSTILSYYAVNSTSLTYVTWDEFFKQISSEKSSD